METRANFVLIGSFTLAVIAAAFGFVLWFQSLHTADCGARYASFSRARPRACATAAVSTLTVFG